jgi:hypothetical protein
MSKTEDLQCERERHNALVERVARELHVYMVSAISSDLPKWADASEAEREPARLMAFRALGAIKNYGDTHPAPVGESKTEDYINTVADAAVEATARGMGLTVPASPEAVAWAKAESDRIDAEHEAKIRADERERLMSLLHTQGIPARSAIKQIAVDDVVDWLGGQTG